MLNVNRLDWATGTGQCRGFQRPFCGKRDSHKMLKLLRAYFQPWTAVHFLARFLDARYMTLRTASSLRNATRVLIALRRRRLSDSMALVVQMILRISGGNWKRGMTPSQLRRHKALIDGYRLSHCLEKSASCRSASSRLVAR